MRHLPFFHARQTRKTTTSTLNPIHKVSPRATIFAAGVESASTARNSSSVLLTVKSPFVQKYFALPLLFSANLLYAVALLCLSMPLHCKGQPGLSMPSQVVSEHLCVLALLHAAPQFLCGSSPRSTLPFPSFSRLCIAVAMKRYAFALHSRVARICSTPLRCLAAHTTPSLAFAFRHEALHFLCFAYRGKSDPSEALTIYAFALRFPAEPCLCPALHCSDYLCPC